MKNTDNHTRHSRRDRAATKTRIIEAARTVFSTRGYDRAGVREIADLASANPSLINRYFGSKEGLLIALTDQFVAARREGDLGYPPQETLGQEIYYYLHDKLTSDLEHEAMIRLMISRSAVDSQYRAKTMHNMDGLADANFRERVIGLQRNGKTEKSLDINLLFASVLHFSFSVNFFGVMIAARPEHEIDALFKAFSEAMAQGLPVPSATPC